jgi:hypothetical protein
MSDMRSDRRLPPRRGTRIPKEGAGYSVLRFLGGFLQGAGVLVLAAAVLGSCYGSFRAVQSFLPYQDQKMAGFVTIITFSYILVFFLCALLLGGWMTVGGILLRRAGTRRAPDAPDVPGGSAAAGGTGCSRN